ncbi:uncharacterized protein LOC135817858 [Sycon ciliatum]|uniref:uncharacterized protein LOC135817858 n=1 Tax=Sycon ciliatum TaxID=27933 RepID=UPI0020A99E3F|eukprot:scpid99944/ scgid9560/ 
MAGLVARNALRAVRGLPAFARGKATAVAAEAPAPAYRPNANTVIPENKAMREFRLEREHAGAHQDMWAWVLLFGFVPAVAYSFKYSYDEEVHHMAHAKEHPAEWVGYDYIRIEQPMGFTYSWRTLFHNRLVNALPEGKDY